MAKRLSRGRLFTINQYGQSITSYAGAGIEDSIGQQGKNRDGSRIVTDYQIDLGNAAAPASSFATVGTGTGANAVIGVSSSSGTHGNAQITLLSNTTHGYVAELELICVEAPTTGEDNIGLWYGNNISGSGAPLDNGGTLLITAADQTVGLVGNDLPDVDLGGKYLYLASSGSSAGVYAAGKFVLRVYGYPAFDDV